MSNNEYICSNCNSNKFITLNYINSNSNFVVTSDAQLIENIEATRILCLNCGCIEIHYIPLNRLIEYFKNEYNISEEVQNNLIVYKNKVINKHSRVNYIYFKNLKKINKYGNFLEIACGKGELTRIFHDKYPTWKCYGIDPSSDASESNQKNLIFIKDIFKVEYFNNIKFDFIVAHGFLNRSPVIPELIKIKELSKKGTILSIEIILLEQSEFTPYIWDHSYTYIEDTFKFYLAKTGFKVLSKTNFVSAINFLCEFIGENIIYEFPIKKSVIKITEKLFNVHLKWWDKIKSEYEKQIKLNNNKKIILFGAGLYNSVLVSIIKDINIYCVIDEIKTGYFLNDIKIISMKDIDTLNDYIILLCCRPEYKKLIESKLIKLKLNYKVLFK